MGKPLASQALDKLGKDWSVASQTRESKLQATTRFADFVQEKFGLQNLQNLKPGHIEKYAGHLRETVSARTAANYMSAVRDVCAAIGKASIVARSNSSYGFNVDSRMNPMKLNIEKVSEIRGMLEARAAAGDRVSLMMTTAAEVREQFGLRHQEALLSCKVIEREGKHYLTVAGAKGGRPRELEVKTDGQRAAIARIAETAAGLGNANGRIIPPELSLRQARSAESREWRCLGGTRANSANMHAVRHEYAQSRVADGASRGQVNTELGHGEARSLGSYVEK